MKLLAVAWAAMLVAVVPAGAALAPTPAASGPERGDAVASTGGVGTGVIVAASNDAVAATAHGSPSVVLKEVRYEGGADTEFVELFVNATGANATLRGWTLRTGSGETITLPAVRNVSSYAWVVVRVGSGTDDRDAGDGAATVYAGRDAGVLADDGDDVTLVDADGTVRDVLRYGGGSGASPAGDWNATDPGPTAGAGESVQLFGPDTDDGTNWVASPPTPGDPSVVTFTAAGYGVEVTLHDGVRTPEPVFRPGLSIDDVTIHRGPGVSLADARRFREYVNQTLSFYEELGFNDPETGGDGDVDVHLRNATRARRTPATGATAPTSSNVYVWVGGNETMDKRVVEHELMHAVQLRRFTEVDGDTYVHISPLELTFKDEAFAEFFAIQSVVRHLNLTEEEFFRRAKDYHSPPRAASTYDVEECLDDVDRDHFTNWANATGWSGYVCGYLFVAYLNETYGTEKLLDIYGAQRNYVDTTNATTVRQSLDETSGPDTANETTGIDAIEGGFAAQPEHRNVTFEDVFTNWTLWLYERFRANVTAENVGSLGINATGPPVSDRGTLRPWGFNVERILVVNDDRRTVNLTFEGDPRVNYSITVLVEPRDPEDPRDDPETVRFRGNTTITLTNRGYDNVTLIKRQLDGEAVGATNYTLRGDYVPVDLELEKRAEEADDRGTYRFVLTARNRGAADSGPFTVTDALDLPPGASVEGVTPASACTHDDGTVTCEFGNLAPGATVELTVEVAIPAGATVRNAAEVVPNPESAMVDPAGNNRDSVVLTASGPSLPPLPGVDRPPRDLDGDGRFEDTDGDETFDIVDVAVLLDAFESAPVTDNREAFDFDGDGTIDILDVADLLART